MLKRPFINVTAAVLLMASVLPARVPASIKHYADKGTAANNTALPLELAFSMRSLGGENTPALSPDGKLLAYCVHTPVVKNPGDHSHSTLRFMPNGTPASLVGSQLFITAVATGETDAIGPNKGSSWRPRWSPDNKVLAFYSDAQGVPQLWAYDVESRGVRRVSELQIKAKLWTGDEPYWSADSREVFVPVNLSAGAQQETRKAASASSNGPSVTAYHSGGELEGIPREARPDAAKEHFINENCATLAAINVSTGAMRVVVPAEANPQPSCLRISPAGNWVSYLSVFHKKGMAAKSHYDLAVAPSSGKPVRVIATDLEVPEDNYFGRTYQWLPSNDRLLYFKNNKLWLADLRGDKIAVRQMASEWEALSPTTLTITRDGRAALVRVERVNNSGTPSARSAALGVVPLDGGKPRLIHFQSNQVFRQVVEAAPGRLWQPQQGSCTVLATDAQSGERVVARLDLETGQTVTIFKGRAIFNFVGSPVDHQSILATFESAYTSPDIYWFNQDLSERRRITRIEPRLSEINIGSVEMFTTTTTGHDGKQISVKTAMLLPQGAKRGDRLPTVVIIYGGASYSNYANRFGGGSPASIPTLIFVSRGYAVMLPDVLLAPEGAASNPVKNITDVLLPQVHHAAELGYTDINRVALIGQSYGGYSTASVISQTGLFRAAVAISGLYDLGAMYSYLRAGGATWGFNWSEKGQGRMGTHPWGDLGRYTSNSPYYQADRVNTPLLLVHGKDDSICPVWEAEKMYAALKRFDKTAQLAIYAGEGHVVSEWAMVNAIDASQRILNFLDNYLMEKYTQTSGRKKALSY